WSLWIAAIAKAVKRCQDIQDLDIVLVLRNQTQDIDELWLPCLELLKLPRLSRLWLGGPRSGYHWRSNKLAMRLRKEGEEDVLPQETLLGKLNSAKQEMERGVLKKWRYNIKVKPDW